MFTHGIGGHYNCITSATNFGSLESSNRVKIDFSALYSHTPSYRTRELVSAPAC